MVDVDAEMIERIIKLNKEIREIIKRDTPENKTIIIDPHAWGGMFKHNITEEQVRKALKYGLHLEDRDQYPEDPDKKHKGKNFYCNYRYKEAVIYARYMLISYLKRPEKIRLISIHPKNFMCEEFRRYQKIMKYKEIKDALKNLSP